MEAYVGRLDALIGSMAPTDFLDIIDGLGAAHIAVLYDGVVVVLRGGKLQYIGGNLSPAVRVLAVTPCKGHRIADMMGAAVIAGEHEVGALVLFADIREGLLEFLNEFGGSGDVGLRIVEFVARHSQMVGSARHDLHEAFGTSEGHCTGVEGRLLIALGGHEAPVPAHIAAVLLEVAIVVGDDALVLVEHRREDTPSHLFDGEQVGLFLLGCFDARGAIPLAQGLNEISLLRVGLDVSRLSPRHKVDIPHTELLCEFGAVAADIDAQTNTQRVSKLLTDEVLGAQRLAVIVVIGIGACERSHNQLTAGLDFCEVEILGHVDGIEHRAVGRDDALLLMGAGEEEEPQNAPQEQIIFRKTHQKCLLTQKFGANIRIFRHGWHRLHGNYVILQPILRLTKKKMLRIAVQSKGRLFDDTMNLLAEADIKVSASKRTLLVQSSNFPLEVLYLRDDDIPQSVASGVADIGVVGENEFVERGEDADIISRLGFSKCRLSLAIPKEIDYKGVEWFNGKKIATSYPGILRHFLEEHHISAEIHVITGSVEISPGIGLADGIFDIVSSGSTLVSNNLREVEVVMQSEALLIGNKQMSDEKRHILEQMLFRFKAVKDAEDKKYVRMNAPKVRLQEIIDVLPGLKSPTIIPLADDEWCSVHTVLDQKQFWEIIGKLKEMGAQGILVTPIEKMIL